MTETSLAPRVSGAMHSYKMTTQTTTMNNTQTHHTDAEVRLAPDMCLYTQHEFLTFFGSLELWDAAAADAAPPPPPPPRARKKLSPRQVPCRSGAQCLRQDCHFVHPTGWTGKQATPKPPVAPPEDHDALVLTGVFDCLSGAACQQVDCAFAHGPPMASKAPALARLDVPPRTSDLRARRRQLHQLDQLRQQTVATYYGTKKKPTGETAGCGASAVRDHIAAVAVVVCCVSAVVLLLASYDEALALTPPTILLSVSGALAACLLQVDVGAQVGDSASTATKARPVRPRRALARRRLVVDTACVDEDAPLSPPHLKRGVAHSDDRSETKPAPDLLAQVAQEAPVEPGAVAPKSMPRVKWAWPASPTVAPAEEAAEVPGGKIAGGVQQPPALPPMPLQTLLKDGDRVTALFRPNSRRWKAATVVGWKIAAADGRRVALRLTFDGFDDVAEVPEAAVETRVRAVPKKSPKKSRAPAGAVGEGGGAVPCKSIPPPPPPVATPEGWTEYYDTEASRVYYCHALSGATQWERPE